MHMYLASAPDGAFPSDLAHLQRHDLGTIYAHISSSDGRSAGSRAMTVLEALGKNADVAGTKDYASENVTLLPTWLLAHRTRWVVLPDLCQLGTRTLYTVLQAIALSEANVLAVDRVHSHAQTAAVLDRYGPTPAAWDRVEQLIGHGEGETQRGPSDDRDTADVFDDYRVVPETDWPTFRADCRDLLAENHFAASDSDYRDAYFAAQGHLIADPSPTTESTRVRLAAVCLTARSAAQATVRIRATQAAFFAGGWNLRIDRGKLIGRLAQTRQLKLTTADFVALRAYRDPKRAALCILHDAGIPKAQLSQATIADIVAACDAGTLNGLPLHRDAVPFLTAAVLDRRRTTSDEAASLFDMLPGTATSMLNRAARDLGLFVGAAYTGNNANTLNYWQYRDGFLLGRVR